MNETQKSADLKMAGTVPVGAMDAKPAAGPSNPLEMLIQDHNHVKANFEQFENADDDEKYSLFVDTVLSLVVHTKLEEELIYPLLTEHSDDKEEEDSKNEAEEEHRVVDFVITEMKEMDQSDEKFDAKFKVLSELVKHHIKEEEEEMFPALREMDIDFEELQEQMLERKAELEEEYSDLDAVEPLESPVTRSSGRKRSTKNAKSSKSKSKASAKSTAKKSGGNKSSAKSKTTKSKTASGSKKTSGTSKAKTGTKKSVGKKATAKKTGAKKTATKKAHSKKSTAKKSTTKKTSTKATTGKPSTKKASSGKKTAGTTRKSNSGSSAKKTTSGSKKSRAK